MIKLWEGKERKDKKPGSYSNLTKHTDEEVA